MCLSIRAALVASLIAAVALPATAHAQYGLRIQRNDEPRVAADSVVQRKMHHDIVHIRLAQDSYFAGFGKYAEDLSVFSHMHLESGAKWVLTDVTATTWKLVATHPKLTGEYRLSVQRPPATATTKAAPAAPKTGKP